MLVTNTESVSKVAPAAASSSSSSSSSYLSTAASLARSGDKRSRRTEMHSSDDGDGSERKLTRLKKLQKRYASYSPPEESQYIMVENVKFPKYYRGGHAKDLDMSEDERPMTPERKKSTSENGSPMLDEKGRPRRARVRPESFINYRQENEIKTPEKDDPYEDFIHWIKLAGHPHWPGIKLSDDGFDALNDLNKIKLEKEIDRLRSIGANPVAVQFLGNRGRCGVARDDGILPYSENFDQCFKPPPSSKDLAGFRRAVEEADELILKERAKALNSSQCAICRSHVVTPKAVDALVRGFDDTRKDTDDPMRCEICFDVVHATCTEGQGEFIVGFGCRERPEWWCPKCVALAPFSLKARIHEEERTGTTVLSRANKRGVSVRVGLGIGTTGKKLKRKCDSNSSDGPASKKSRANGSGARGRPPGAKRLGRPPGKRSSTPTRNGASSSIASAGGKRRAASAPSRDVHDDSCFVCGDGGVLLVCDFPGCSRSYHKYCLRGHEFEAEDELEGKIWHCPWHVCAFCAEKEDLEGGSGSEVQNLGRKRTNATPPALSTIERSVAIELAEDLPSSSEIWHEDTGFLRCASCPTALCQRHHNETRPVFAGLTHVTPMAIWRRYRKGFFKCVHCAGVSINGTNVDPSPLVDLSQQIHRVWSRIVNGNEHVCSVLMQPVHESIVPEEAVDVFRKLRDDKGVTSLINIRSKVWRLEYTSWEAFKEDLDHLVALARSAYGPKSALLRETLESFPLIVQKAFNVHRDEMSAIEESLLKLNKDALGGAFHESKGNGKTDKSKDAISPLRSGILYPSVVCSERNIPQPRPNARKRSVVEWENYLANVSFSKAKKLADLGKKPARDEARGICAALVKAADVVGEFKLSLPPSKQTIDELLEQQSTILRSALRSTAFLRNAVNKTLEGFTDPLNGPPEDQVCFGELRIAAEYKSIAENLKTRNEQLITMLGLERQARRAAEEKLEELMDKESKRTGAPVEERLRKTKKTKQ